VPPADSCGGPRGQKPLERREGSPYYEEWHSFRAGTLLVLSARKQGVSPMHHKEEDGVAWQTSSE
jgi:hypothetical protein